MDKDAFLGAIQLLQDARPELRFRPGTIDLFREALETVPDEVGREALKTMALDDSKRANVPTLLALVRELRGPTPSREADAQSLDWERDAAAWWLDNWDRHPKALEIKDKHPAIYAEELRLACRRVFSHRMHNYVHAAMRVIRNQGLLKPVGHFDPQRWMSLAGEGRVEGAKGDTYWSLPSDIAWILKQSGEEA